MVWSVAQVHTNGGRDFNVTFNDANENGTIDIGAEQTQVLTAINSEITRLSTPTDGGRPTFQQSNNDHINEQAALPDFNAIDSSRSTVARVPSALHVSRAVAEYLGWHRPPERQTISARVTSPITTPSDIPNILDETAASPLRRAVLDSRATRTQSFLDAIGRASALTNASVPTEGVHLEPPLERNSLVHLLRDLPASFRPHTYCQSFSLETDDDDRSKLKENGTTTPYIFTADHGLSEDQRIQLIRWLDRNRLPAGSVAERYRLNDHEGHSSLSITFNQMHVDLTQAYNMYMGQNPERLGDDAARRNLLLGCYVMRMHYPDIRTPADARPDQLREAEQELSAYSQIVDSFRSLTSGGNPADRLPQLGATPENRRARGSGGSRGGHGNAGASSSNLGIGGEG